MEGLLEILSGLAALVATLLGEARAARISLVSWPALALVAAGLVAGFLLGRRGRRPASGPRETGLPFPQPIALDLGAIRPLGAPAEEAAEARFMDVSGIRPAEELSPSAMAPTAQPELGEPTAAVPRPPPPEAPKPPRPTPAQKPRPSPPR